MLCVVCCVCECYKGAYWFDGCDLALTLGKYELRKEMYLF